MKALRFKQEHVAPILTRVKTETRRPQDPQLAAGDLVLGWVSKPGSYRSCTFCWGTTEDPVNKDLICRWCKGSARVPELPFASLQIHSVYPQKVGDFTDANAIAEGYSSVDDIWELLSESCGELDLGMVMHAVRFELEENHVPRNATEAAEAFERWRVSARS